MDSPAVGVGAARGGTSPIQYQGVVYYLPGTTGWGATFGGLPTAVLVAAPVAPAITIQPQSLTVTPGAAVRFNAAAAGAPSLALQWQLSTDSGLSWTGLVDGAGNVYVADANNNTIRRVTPAGSVTTIGGIAGVAGSLDGIGGAA